MDIDIFTQNVSPKILPSHSYFLHILGAVCPPFSRCRLYNLSLLLNPIASRYGSVWASDPCQIPPASIRGSVSFPSPLLWHSCSAPRYGSVVTGGRVSPRSSLSRVTNSWRSLERWRSLAKYGLQLGLIEILRVCVMTIKSEVRRVYRLFTADCFHQKEVKVVCKKKRT